MFGYFMHCTTVSNIRNKDKYNYGVLECRIYFGMLIPIVTLKYVVQEYK